MSVDSARQGRRHSPRAKISLVLLLVAASSYAALYLLMWVPTYLGGSRWLFLYPLFLALLVLIGAIAISAAVFGAMAFYDAIRARRLGHSLTPSWAWGLIGSCVFLILALPVLWFGPAIVTFIPVWTLNGAP